MIKVSNVEVFNFEGAFRGLRNPMNSWDKSDSIFGVDNYEFAKENMTEVIAAWMDLENEDRINNGECELSEVPMLQDRILDSYIDWFLDNGTISSNGDIDTFAFLGPNDLNLAQRMIKGGPEEAKFLRQIFVSMDITAPIYWHKEMSTYKIGTTANSCSTMHKLTAEPITMEDFSFDAEGDGIIQYKKAFQNIVDVCEDLRISYNTTKNPAYWRALIQTLPMSYNQKRTWTANYQVLHNIYSQRKNHKLVEWKYFCEILKSLPYGKELICYDGR